MEGARRKTCAAGAAAFGGREEGVGCVQGGGGRRTVMGRMSQRWINGESSTNQRWANDVEVMGSMGQRWVNLTVELVYGLEVRVPG